MSMPKRVLGKTGLKVSPLGFGCMRLPLVDKNDKESIDAPLATAMLRKAIDSGVNYVDTAWPYHGNNFPQPGRSEPFVAKALADGYRDKVHLATKLPVWIVETRADMDRYLDEQLRRLDTRCLDVYLIHNLNSATWPKLRDLGVFSFLDGAVKDGRIRYPGFSFHDNISLFREIVDAYDWQVAQIQYNYLDTSYQAGEEGLRLLEKKGIGAVIMEPLRGGFLVNNIPANCREMLRKARPDWSLAAWGLRWLFDQPAIGTVLSGMSTMEQVEENLVTAATPSDFNQEDRKTLADVRAWFTKHMPIPCTDCGYCLPCPRGVKIPNNFAYYNEYHLDDTAGIRERGANMYSSSMKAEHRASNCVACGVCEERCPQNIAIPEKMKEVAKTFAK